MGTPLHGVVRGHRTRFPDQEKYPQPGGTYMDYGTNQLGEVQAAFGEF